MQRCRTRREKRQRRASKTYSGRAEGRDICLPQASRWTGAACLVWHFCWLSLLALFLAGPASAGGILALPAAEKTAPLAIAQTNSFSLGNPIAEKLLDGFQSAGFKCLVDDAGRIAPATAPTVVVDRRQDLPLRQTIASARQRCSSRSPRDGAIDLARSVRDLLFPPGSSWAAMDRWDDRFKSEHRGERILIGQWIKERRGVCEQQAVLLKVLADECRLPCTLTMGFINGSPHVWTVIEIAGKPLVFDPSRQIYAVPVRSARQYRTMGAAYGSRYRRMQELTEQLRGCPAGEHGRTIAILRELAEIDESSLGSGNLASIISLEMLARAYRRAGKLEQALATYLKALQVASAALGQSHPYCADLHNFAASQYALTGAEDKAREHYARAISIYRQAFGPHSRAIADVEYNLGELNRRSGDSKQARRNYARAASIYASGGSAMLADYKDALARLQEIDRSRR